jgi:hypothetical protein
MIDKEKEFTRLENALSSMAGIHRALEFVCNGVEIRQGDHAQRFRDAVGEMLHLIELRLDEAENASYALRHGKYCQDDPHAKFTVVS